MARNRETKGGSQELTAASCRHHLGPPPLLFVALLLLLAAPSYAADFTRTFTGITKGADLTLEWDGIDARSMPLTIHAVVVNRTGEENRANVFKRNLAGMRLLAVGSRGRFADTQRTPSRHQRDIMGVEKHALAASIPPDGTVSS